MKRKILLISLFLVLLITGCSIGNTPKSKVETLLMKYKDNNDTILTELDNYLDTLEIEENSHNDYKKVYTKQYTDMTYEIKDELIDGDNASVTVQIEVYDYYKIENEATKYVNDNPDNFKVNNIYDAKKVLEYKLDKLNKAKDRVNYTLIFNLTKVDNEWTIDKLSEEDLEKIHGIYAH